MIRRPRAVLLAALLLTTGAGCNTKTRANERRCGSLGADACRADPTCVAVGGPVLEPHPPAIVEGGRCEPGCAKGWMPDECGWAPARAGAAADRVAHDGRVCDGPPRSQVQHSSTGDHCQDPTPPCGVRREVFVSCQSANLCSGVICP